MQRLQMVGGRRHFGLGCFQELLIALVDQLRNLAPNLISRVGEDLRAAIVGLLDRGRDVVLPQKHAILCSGSFDQVKAMFAQPTDCVFVGAFFNFG